MQIHFKEITKKSEDYKKVKELYKTAFPKEEQIPFFIMISKIKKDNVKFYSIFDSSTWVGFVYLINYKDLSYVFYFAISDDSRGKGYGGATLKALKEAYPSSRFFLAIEEIDSKYDNYRQRVSRKAFYEKNGFQLLNQKMYESGVVYDLMGTDGKVDADLFDIMLKDYLGVFYKLIKTYIF